ncbi:hypothetical protein OIO90_002165 [Microbotryomycetes sp. JL221]|nr:hypothetical protein OIO90_002165 [Microbotryomycetes sp. JL221]
MAEMDTALQRRITSLTNLRFTTSASACPHPRPFLPVQHPTIPFLSITLPLPDDDPNFERDLTQQVETLSNPDVAMKLSGPPFPYTRRDAIGWNELNEQIWHNALEIYKRTLKGEESDDDWRQAFPNGIFSYLRVAKDVNERDQGQGEWIGDIGIRRWLFEDVQDLHERKRLKQINDERRVGDPDLVWSVGYYVKPSFQGQQITTHALNALIKNFMIPTLGARDIRCSAYVGNTASRRVQEKCGFEYDESIVMWTDVDEARGGGQVQHWVTRYKGGRINEVEAEASDMKWQL